MRAQETIGQGFVFAQKPQQQVLGLNVGRAELAGLITRKEDDAPGFLRITFKHIALPLSSRGEVGQRARPPFHGNPSSPIPLCNQGTNRPTIKSCNRLVLLLMAPQFYLQPAFCMQPSATLQEVATRPPILPTLADLCLAIHFNPYSPMREATPAIPPRRDLDAAATRGGSGGQTQDCGWQ